jgi:hypothetical protein
VRIKPILKDLALTPRTIFIVTKKAFAARTIVRLEIPRGFCYRSTMSVGGGPTSRLWVTIGAAVAIGLVTGSTATAGAKPKTSDKNSELSPSALGIDQNSHGYEPGDEKAKGPGVFDLGGNTLHIDADKKDPTPPVGFEANSQTVFNKAPTEPLLHPSYLGLRLTTPITTPGR